MKNALWCFLFMWRLQIACSVILEQLFLNQPYSSRRLSPCTPHLFIYLFLHISTVKTLWQCRLSWKTSLAVGEGSLRNIYELQSLNPKLPISFQGFTHCHCSSTTGWECVSSCMCSVGSKTVGCSSFSLTCIHLTTRWTTTKVCNIKGEYKPTLKL